jgi:serine/threonine protein kinase
VGETAAGGEEGFLLTAAVGTLFWTAPELLGAPTSKQRYGPEVDVYSYGIVLWEISHRKRPHEDLHLTKFKFVDAILNGLRPSIQPDCQPPLRQLMQDCWSADGAARPGFGAILQVLGSGKTKQQR